MGAQDSLSSTTNTNATQESTTQELPPPVNGAAESVLEKKESSDTAAVDVNNSEQNDDATVNNNQDSEGLQPKREGGQRGGNEDRKIFVGGIAYDVDDDELSSYFSKFGEVTLATVKYDRATGRSRGFAFVEFATTDACKAALAEREQIIKNKQVEIKPAKSREVNKKVFVGGLPADFSEKELRQHFEQFGLVEDIEWPFDKQTKSRRNFAFVVFEEEEAADKAAGVSKQTFGSREADVKKAVPQNRRNNGFFPPRAGGPLTTIRGYIGAGGFRGAPSMGVHNTGTQWYGNSITNGWPQMGSAMAYGASGGAGSAGNWSDWYGNMAANFYQAGGGNVNSVTSYGAYAGANGYDYNQGGGGVMSSSMGRHHSQSHQGGHAQNGSAINVNSQSQQQRYSQHPQHQQSIQPF